MVKVFIFSLKKVKFGFADYRKINPVLMAFEQELGRFIKYMKKKAEQGKKWKKPDEDVHARG